MDSFEKLYSEYYDAVFRYALSLCRSRELAEEVTQETFFKALKGIDSFRSECKLSVWLCQIAKNTFFTMAKGSERQRDLPMETAASEQSIEQQIVNKETALAIHRLLHELPEPYKEVFWMRTFGELTFSEIGAIFGKTDSWARVTYHRAKLKLKEGVK